MAGYGMGASLASYGQGQQQEAMGQLGAVAREETQREISNKQAEAQRKSGNVQLGATAGAMAGMAYGSALGPWGAMVGGLVGAVAGGLF